MDGGLTGAQLLLILGAVVVFGLGLVWGIVLGLASGLRWLGERALNRVRSRDGDVPG